MLHSGRSHVGSVQAWRAAVKAVTYTTTTTTTTAVTINGVRTLELDGPWMTEFRSLMTPCARQHLASQRRPDLTYGCCHAEMPQFFSAVFVSSQTTAYWASDRVPAAVSTAAGSAGGPPFLFDLHGLSDEANGHAANGTEGGSTQDSKALCGPKS